VVRLTSLILGFVLSVVFSFLPLLVLLFESLLLLSLLPLNPWFLFLTQLLLGILVIPVVVGVIPVNTPGGFLGLSF
jgi:hypothetical protein